MRADELFRIDAVAELRALCEERLQGGWEVPAELVRFVLARDADSVAVELGQRSLLVRAAGPVMTRRDLELLAAALAVHADGEERHRALVALEEREIDALLFVAALHGRRTSFRWVRRDATLCLSLPAATIEELATGGEPGIEIRVRGARFDHDRALEWLHEACRFVATPVLVNGARVRQGFPDGLFRMGIGSPLTGQVAIASHGHTPTLHLLRHGVVAARANVPGYPAFHAAVEMSGSVPHGASAAALRDAVRPHLTGVIDAALQLMIRLVPRLASLAPEVRRRLALLLLEAAARKLRTRELCALPILEGFDDTGCPAFMSIDDLTAAACRNGGVVQVLSPDDDPRRFALGSGSVAVLDAAQRAKLREIADLHFRSPIAVQPTAGGHRPWRVRMTEMWRHVVHRLPAGRSRGVDAAELTREEAIFLRALAASGLRFADDSEPCWQLCRGRRLVYGGPHGTLRLGRRHPLVVSAVAAVAEDVNALYPGVLALDLPFGLSLHALREAWWRGIGERTRAVDAE